MHISRVLKIIRTCSGERTDLDGERLPEHFVEYKIDKTMINFKKDLDGR